MQITTTTAKSGKINLYGDGSYLFSIPASVWFSSPLCGENELNEEQLAVLQEAAGFVYAYDSALRSLALRGHAKKELSDKLRRKYSREAADAAVAKCEELGLLDDRKFAGALAAELYEHKHYAPLRIKEELLARGIAREIVSETVSALDIDEKMSIMVCVERWVPAGVVPTEKERKRLVSRLLRMGFRLHDIFDALPESFSATDSDGEDY